MTPLPAGRRFLSMLAPGLVLAFCSILDAADQPQFGQRHSRNMVSTERGLPVSFDPKTGANIKWSVPLGTEAYSTPVVAEGRVLIGTNNEIPRDPKHQGDRGVLMCFNESDGSLAWQLMVPKRGGDEFLDWPKVGICSSAAVEDGRVYVVNNRGEVLCLDLQGMANGNTGPYRDEGIHMTPPGSPALEPGPTDADIVWIYDMVSGVGIWTHDSAHTAILVHGDHLYLNTGNGVDNTHRVVRSPDAPSLIVLDKRTGRLIARDNERIGPRIFHCTWSPPSLGVVNGKPLVFFAGGDGSVFAFEPVKTAPPPGEVLSLKKVWTFDFDPAGPKENVHQFTGNRRESPSNIYGSPVFHENRIFVAGGGDVFWGKAEAWLKCIDTTQTGDVTNSAELWSYPLVRHTMATPAIHDGMVFVTDCRRTVHCVDASTGKPYWTHETRGDIWASPLVADGKVYVGTRRGDFWTFAASREKEILGTVELGSPISATAIAANGVLYVATRTHLYAAHAK